ncbi:unnamed protein product [Closterium sp. Yama58-4]|nr:unnamed protein product [Closterium sp. Yama58-4]
MPLCIPQPPAPLLSVRAPLAYGPRAAAEERAGGETAKREADAENASAGGGGIDLKRWMEQRVRATGIEPFPSLHGVFPPPSRAHSPDSPPEYHDSGWIRAPPRSREGREGKEGIDVYDGKGTKGGREGSSSAKGGEEGVASRSAVMSDVSSSGDSSDGSSTGSNEGEGWHASALMQLGGLPGVPIHSMDPPSRREAVRRARQAALVACLLEEGFRLPDLLRFASTRCALLTTSPTLARERMAYLRAIGLPASDVPRLVARCPKLLTYRVDTRMAPRIDFLLALGVPPDRVARVVQLAPAIFDAGYRLVRKVEMVVLIHLFLSPPVLFLSPPVLFLSPPVLFLSPPVMFLSPPVLARQNALQLSDEDVVKVVVRSPQVLTQSVQGGLVPRLHYFLHHLALPLPSLASMVVRAMLLGMPPPHSSYRASHHASHHDVTSIAPHVTMLVMSSFPPPQPLPRHQPSTAAALFIGGRGAPAGGVPQSHRPLQPGCRTRALPPAPGVLFRLPQVCSSACPGVLFRLPQILSLSVPNCLAPKYDYLIHHLGGSPSSIVSFPAYFSLSLHARIRPRHLFYLRCRAASAPTAAPPQLLSPLSPPPAHDPPASPRAATSSSTASPTSLSVLPLPTDTSLVPPPPAPLPPQPAHPFAFLSSARPFSGPSSPPPPPHAPLPSTAFPLSLLAPTDEAFCKRLGLPNDLEYQAFKHTLASSAATPPQAPKVPRMHASAAPPSAAAQPAAGMSRREKGGAVTHLTSPAGEGTGKSSVQEN